MPPNEPMTSDPMFYALVAGTAVLSLGYQWGKRRNGQIVRAAFGALVDAVEPQEQSFTNIGGLTGYHAVLIPPEGTLVRRIEATITLLPRQAWLYLPVSLLIRRHDRLAISLELAEGSLAKAGEAHLVIPAHARRPTSRITGTEEMSEEIIDWSGTPFALYCSGGDGKSRLDELRTRMPAPGSLCHVAVVPSRSRVHVSMVPRPEDVAACVSSVYAWVRDWR